MRSSKLILAIGLTIALVGVAGCGSKIRYPSYYVLNVPAPIPANANSKPILGPVAVREFRDGMRRPAPKWEAVSFPVETHSKVQERNWP